MKHSLQQLDQFLADYLPPVTRRVLYGLTLVHFFWAVARLALSGSPAGALLERLFVLRPTQFLFQGNLWQVLTYALGHENVIHLLGNMIGIGFFGSMVEQRLGERRYWWFILLAVLSAGVAHVAVSFALGRPEVGLLGVSAAVFAMLVAAGIWFPRRIILLMFVFPVPLGLVALLYGLYLVLSVVESVQNFRGGMSELAHLMGVLTAVILVKNPGILARLEFVRIPFLSPKKRRPARVLSMGHPGRHSDPDDRYNDPHWYLDQ